MGNISQERRFLNNFIQIIILILLHIKSLGMVPNLIQFFLSDIKVYYCIHLS